MARYGILKRNIKRNIKSWSTDDAANAKGGRSTVSKIVAVFMALCLSGAFVPLAVNVVFRIPDLYSFDLSRTQVAADITENVKDADVADAISAFMKHDTDVLQLRIQEGDQQITLFTGSDAEVMGRLRSFLDNIFVIGLTSLVAFVALYFMLVKWDRPKELRRGFMGGFVLYGVLICFTAFTIVFGGPAMKFWEDITGAGFAPGDVMPKLFQGGFFLISWLVAAVTTFVIMLILLSVTNRLTSNEKMF
jgi:hypothetical protein